MRLLLILSLSLYVHLCLSLVSLSPLTTDKKTVTKEAASHQIVTVTDNDDTHRKAELPQRLSR